MQFPRPQLHLAANPVTPSTILRIARPQNYPPTRALVLWAALSALLCEPCAKAEQLQPRKYEDVDTYSIRQGRVPIGKWIEKKGHAWFSDREARFNDAQMAAAAPIPVDVSELDTGLLRRLRAECPSIPRNTLGGGCEVMVRGQIGMVDSTHGIHATEIEIRAKGAR
jgi:hypothetical protein